MPTRPGRGATRWWERRRTAPSGSSSSTGAAGRPTASTASTSNPVPKHSCSPPPERYGPGSCWSDGTGATHPRRHAAGAYCATRSPATTGSSGAPGAGTRTWRRSSAPSVPQGSPVTRRWSWSAPTAKHDTCCAVRGRPVGRALSDRWPELVWECTHVGGDRFAANVVVAPDGVYYGNLDAASSVEAVEQHLADRIHMRPSARIHRPLPAAAGRRHRAAPALRPGGRARVRGRRDHPRRRRPGGSASSATRPVRRPSTSWCGPTAPRRTN